MDFADDIYNDDEDGLSDDEVVTKIKVQKCREATKRADMMTEDYAIDCVVMGTREAAKNVDDKSVVPRQSLDLLRL